MKKEKDVNTKETILSNLENCKGVGIAFQIALIVALLLFVLYSIKKYTSGEFIFYGDCIETILLLIGGIIGMNTIVAITGEARNVESVFHEKGRKACEILQKYISFSITIDIITQFFLAHHNIFIYIAIVFLYFIMKMIISMYILGYELQKEVDEIL